MSKILIIAEHDGETLNQATAKVVSCAAAIGGERHQAGEAVKEAPVKGELGQAMLRVLDTARQAPTVSCLDIINFTVNNEAQFTGDHNSSLFVRMRMDWDCRSLSYFELTHQCIITVNQGR